MKRYEDFQQAQAEALCFTEYLKQANQEAKRVEQILMDLGFPDYEEELTGHEMWIRYIATTPSLVVEDPQGADPSWIDVYFRMDVDSHGWDARLYFTMNHRGNNLEGSLSWKHTDKYIKQHLAAELQNEFHRLVERAQVMA